MNDPLMPSAIPPIPEPEINWGYNCLTSGIHHGRPEALWTLPLLQAATMFTDNELQAMVVGRIHTDALIMVHRGEDNPEWLTEEWAQRLKEEAENLYGSLLEAKLDELNSYYDSPAYRRDMTGIVVRVLDNRLNPHFNPLHNHDSVNMLCRILGMSACRRAGA